jgi:hypothetical protein
VRLLELGRITSFSFNGEVRELVDPDGLATARQLLKLNRLGLLAAVDPAQAPLSKSEAAWLIDQAVKDKSP